MAPSVNINRLAAIRQVLATGIATTPFPPPWPAVRPCRVHGGKSRPCGQLARRRNVGDVAAAIRQVLATGLADYDGPRHSDAHRIGTACERQPSGRDPVGAGHGVAAMLVRATE